MTSNRPYHEEKKPKSPAMAFAEVEKMAGRQFDPTCAAAFLAIRDQVVQAMTELMPGCDIGAATPSPMLIDAPETARP
jgi:HD-GYP domain-containing protein (c-di-GMP phosphodiesterase class II)